jgi:hypothetical protein
MKKLIIPIMLILGYPLSSEARYQFNGMDMLATLNTGGLKISENFGIVEISTNYKPPNELLLNRGLIEGALDGTYQMYQCDNNHDTTAIQMIPMLTEWLTKQSVGYLTRSYYTNLISRFIKDTFCGPTLARQTTTQEDKREEQIKTDGRI